MIIANIASVPDRKKELARVVRDLYPQVDKINVGLNNYNKIPVFLKKEKINAWVSDNSVGDAEKFRSDDKGYYFTCDDDMLYPDDYVQTMISTLDNYNKDVILTCHGRAYKGRVQSYNRGWAEFYHCLHEVAEDSYVTVGGTGVMLFHTDSFQMDISDFDHKNMADIFVARKAKAVDVPIVCMAHETGWIRYQETMKGKQTIYDDTVGNDSLQTAILNSFNNS